MTQEGRATGAQVYQPPGTADEFQLVQIWRDLLGVEKIGITDSFFDLGGNSLSAVQMMARVRESFGTSLSLRQLFEKPTVSALALMLDVSRSGIAASASGERSMAPPPCSKRPCYLPISCLWRSYPANRRAPTTGCC
ncbi:phosphopantetheine-binding protein [Pseudomonas sp. PCH446]